MKLLKKCRWITGMPVPLALFLLPTTGFSQQITAHSLGSGFLTPSTVVPKAMPVNAGPITSWAPQGAKLYYTDTTLLTPFASCNAVQAWPWAAEYSPDGNHLYVSLFGGYTGSGGCTMLKL
ncbi:MAG: hypothetical protein KDB61_11480, partial [Planctomycetes bacterium]|nr:hypothetical protein [Planctomycetota bacterium]